MTVVSLEFLLNVFILDSNNVLVFVVLITYDTVFFNIYMYIQSGYFSKSFQNVRECRNMKSVFAAVAITDKQ